MFFRKKKSDEEIIENLPNNAPVYIIGTTPLALYLALKIQNSGEKTILVTLAEARRKLRGKELVLKEEHNLQKSKASLSLTSIIEKQPKLIIVAADFHNLKSHLTLLPTKAFPDTPIICFSGIYDLDSIRPLFGRDFCKAYFQGALDYRDETISLIGSSPQITFSYNSSGTLPDILHPLFEKTEISADFQENDNQNFWEYFAPYALTYLASTPLVSIADYLKNKDLKKDLMLAATELETLAKADNAHISKELIIRELSEIPANYNPKNKQSSLAAIAAELDSLYTILSDKARIYKRSLPHLNRMLKNNYDYLLRK